MANPTTIPAQILDGAPPTGTKGTVTINTVVFPVLDEHLTPSWDETLDKTFNALPNRGRWVKGRYKLSLTLQLSQASAVNYGDYAALIPGSTFPYPVQNETGTPLTFILLTVPVERTNQGGIETAKIEAVQAIGAVTYS